MRPEKVWQIFIFQYPSKFTYINAVHDAAIVAVSMHTCELTRRRGERHAKTARAAVSAISGWVEICTHYCWCVNCGKSARSTGAASRSVCAHRGKCCSLIRCPPFAETIKGVETTDLHLWGLAREDDMTDWEPDKWKTYSSISYSLKL